ncbi:MAG TPA: Pr6Pr family membrane protein [Acholeplasmataceae bacterium]|nr:Pr6Pr family membrane protein [Acholeplasmataceae bacterium]
MKNLYKYKNIFALIGLIFGSIAVVNTIAYQGVQAFRYFTNQSNLLFLIVFILLYFKLEERISFKIISFITLISMSITGVVFHLLLTDSVGSTDGLIRSIYDLNNWQNLVTHTINPLYFLIFYTIFIIDDLKIKDFWIGIIHPLAYFILILALSPLTNFYPYPFLDVSLNGLAGVLKMTLLVMLPLIVVFILVLTTANYYLNKKLIVYIKED